jgi:5-formyltetrahydrofolate cyclo-ligase
LAAVGIDLISQLPGQVVSAYMPMRDEIDVMPLLAAIHDTGRTLALPVIEAKWAPLRFRCYAPGDALVPAGFGTKEPSSDRPTCIPDIMLVPLAAFDSRGYRIGYGGGYYDRTLSLYRFERNVTAIGIAFDEQEVPEIPFEPHDQPLDFLLAPSGHRRFGD